MEDELHLVSAGDLPGTPRIVLAFWRTDTTGEFPWGFASYHAGTWQAVSDQGWVEALTPAYWFDLPIIKTAQEE